MGFLFGGFWTLSDEPKFVAVVDFPFNDLARLDINGSSQRQRQIDIALCDGFPTPDSLDLGGIVHIVSLVNKIDIDNPRDCS